MAVALVLGMAVSGCAAAAVGRSNVTESPAANSYVQAQACAELSRVLAPGKQEDMLRPSSAEVPAPLQKTGFGRADAECAFDPSSGLYYTGLIWKRALPESTVRAFVDELHRLGFVDTSAIGTAVALRAPPGVMDVIGGQTQPMQTVQIDSPVNSSLTYIIWI